MSFSCGIVSTSFEARVGWGKADQIWQEFRRPGVFGRLWERQLRSVLPDDTKSFASKMNHQKIPKTPKHTKTFKSQTLSRCLLQLSRWSMPRGRTVWVVEDPWALADSKDDVLSFGKEDWKKHEKTNDCKEWKGVKLDSWYNCQLKGQDVSPEGFA